MPPLPAVRHVVKAIHTGTDESEGLPWAVISHWSYSQPGDTDLTNAQANVIAAKFVNSWRDNISPVTGDDLTDTQVEIIDLTSATAASGLALDGNPGTSGGPMISPSSCLLVSKHIARRYRGGHPRTYWPGAAQNLSTVDVGRSVDSAHVVATTAHLNAYYGDIPPAVTTDGDTGCDVFQEVCVSYHSGGVLRPAPVVDVILSYTPQMVFATQRRRLHRTS